MKEKKISLSFDIGEILHDILVACNLISTGMGDDVALEVKSNIKEPDGENTRTLISRGVTEAFGKVKVACSRYLRSGRITDDNSLERLVSLRLKDENGDELGAVYEHVLIDLYIPNYNTAVTDHLKSSIHQYIVDWCMWRFLQNQIADKAAEYKTIAEEDYHSIVKDLQARENFNFRRATWL